VCIHQVEVARLEGSLRSLTKQLGEAEADYLTGSERLAALAREVSQAHDDTKLHVRHLRALHAFVAFVHA
jgi:hypothetical protein